MLMHLVRVHVSMKNDNPIEEHVSIIKKRAIIIEEHPYHRRNTSFRMHFNEIH